MPQIDYLFKHFDKNQDGFIDIEEWTAVIKDDSINYLI
jgi:Ca2+-binding EF-hand superfamily protein